jgi:hypothetical protein
MKRTTGSFLIPIILVTKLAIPIGVYAQPAKQFEFHRQPQFELMYTAKVSIPKKRGTSR